MAASVEYVLAQLQRWTSPRLEELSDAVLLDRFVQRRDEAAFAALVARHGDMVFRSCRRLLGDAHEAEDAFQATFMILARKAATLRQAAALPAFLHRIARRVALKARSKTARCSGKTRLVEELSDPGPDPLTRLTARELLTVLDEEVARLPSAQRSAVVLCCLEGHAREEAARQLGCTPGSLKGHLERGRRRLQARLLKRGIGLPAALILVAVSRGEAVSALLLRSTVATAMNGTIGGQAAALAHGVLKGMLLSKLASAAVLVLTVALTVSATVAWVYRGSMAETPEDKPPAAVAAKESDAKKPQPRTDAHGDPLPDGAIARLGTVRFRMSGRVYACAWSPDGKTLAAGSLDKTIALFDAATGRPLGQLCGSPFPVTSLAYAPDGRTLAAGSEDVGIAIWKTDTGKILRRFRVRGPAHPVWALAFTPDGEGLLSAGEDAVIRLWEPATGKEVRRFAGHQKDVRCMVLSPDGRTLASAADKEIRLWETATGKTIRRLTEHKVAIRSLAISADGKLLASGSKDGTIYLWETATGKVRHRFAEDLKKPQRAESSHPHALVFSPDGKTLAAGGADYTLSLWDVPTGEKLREIAGVGSHTFTAKYHDGGIQCLVFSRDGKKLLFGRDNSLNWLDVSSAKEVAPFAIHRGAVRRLFFRPDGRRLITTSDDPNRRVLEWDATTGRLIRRVPGEVMTSHLVSFSPDGKLMAATLYDAALHLWDTITGKEVRKIPISLKDDSTALNEVVFSPDGKRLAVVGPMGKAAWLFDAATGKQLHGEESAKNWAFVLARFSADSRLLAFVGNEAIQFFDIPSGRQLRSISLPQDRISFAASLSPDGRTLALASGEWTQEANSKIGSYPPGFAPRVLKVRDITLWETASGKERATIPSPCDRVHGLIFSPDGRLLAVAGEDRAVHLWDTVEGEWLRHLQGHLGEIGTLAFSPDGLRLASGSQDTTALVWDVSGPAKEQRHRGVLTRKELDELWSILAGADAAKAYRAIRTLETVPTQSVPLLAECLRLEPTADAKHIARLIAQLDREDFAERERATTELRRLGWEAEPSLGQALEDKPSLEVRRRVKKLQEDIGKQAAPPELLRMLRGIEILEHVGTPEARKLLASVAGGTARPAHEAKAALERLANRGGN